MNTAGIGDLAQGYLLRSRSAALKQDMQRLNAELTSGQVSDVRKTLSGNYSFLTDVERKVGVLGNYAIAATEASHFTGSMQQALGHFGSLTEGLASSLMVAGTSASGANAADIASDARATLDGLVSTLNVSVAGRSLFAGNATNRAPLTDSAALLADLSTAMGGATTPTDMIASAEAWFNSPAGFEAITYRGSNDALSPFALSPKDSVAVDLRATDPGFTRAMRGAAVAALATDPAFGLSSQDQSTLFGLIGQDLLAGQADILTLQAKVGFAEAQVDTIAARNAAEVTSLNMARNSLLEADPFEAATKLEEVQFQLQSLYSITVRMSQLSLVNYL